MGDSLDEASSTRGTRRLTRRRLVVGAAASATAVTAAALLKEEGRVGSLPSGAVSGIPAAGLGDCRERVFFDDFTGSSIDPCPQPKWFRTLPFGWGATTGGEASVAGSTLRLAPAEPHANWTLATLSPDGRGQAFGYGYFEARLRFAEPEGAVDGWPAFWALEAEHVLGKRLEEWMEIDFFEAMGTFEPPRFYATVHEWHASGTGHVQTHPNYAQVSADWSRWNDFGCLWQPGRVTWYLNRQQVMTASYGVNAPSGAPRLAGIPADPRLAVVLGTAPGWPLDVDWVAVWRQG